MKKLVIPSAGNSTRFFEIGKKYPKSLLPFKNKPLIVYSLEKYTNNFDEIVIVYKDNEELYKEIIDYYEFSNVFLKKVNTKLTQGPATSIFSGINGSENELSIMLSDAIYEFDITTLSPNCISVMEVNDYMRWCMVDEDLNFFDKPIKKPSTKLAVSGVYKFSDPNLFYTISKEYIENTAEETQISEILKIYNSNIKLSLYKHDFKNFIDFGTIEKYIKNKNLPLSRSFNDVVFQENSVIKKTNKNPQKIIDEGLWYQHFPILKHMLPKLIDIDFKEPKIEIELVSGYTLRELFLYYDNSSNLWSNLFIQFKKFITECSKYRYNTTVFWESICTKTSERNKYQDKDFLTYFENLLKSSNFYNESTLFHGDFVFSNLIYEPNIENLKIIDPMGKIYGHWVYDLAKLGQCVLGNYDLIDSELYINDKNYYKLFGVDQNFVQNLFFETFTKEINLITKKVLYSLIASLYLSLIPLHNHNSENQRLYYLEFQKFYELSMNEK